MYIFVTVTIFVSLLLIELIHHSRDLIVLETECYATFVR